MVTFIVVIGAIVLIATVGVLVDLYVNKDDDNYTIDIGGGAPKAAGGSSSSSEMGFRERIAGLGIISGSVLGTLLVAALIAGLTMPPELYAADYSQKQLAPSAEHLFGTDYLGHDMF